MQFPSFGYAEIHPSVALSNDKEFRPLRRATAALGGSAKPFEKGLSENFQKTPPWRSPDKSKFVSYAKKITLEVYKIEQVCYNLITPSEKLIQN